jgi:hypothetical protein
MVERSSDLNQPLQKRPFRLLCTEPHGLAVFVGLEERTGMEAAQTSTKVPQGNEQTGPVSYWSPVAEVHPKARQSALLPSSPSEKRASGKALRLFIRDWAHNREAKIILGISKTYVWITKK